MLLKNLKLPIKLIHSDLKTVEIIDNIDYLKYQTKLGVKEDALLNCIIKDHNNYYEIIEIIDHGEKGPWWKFEYFNPMKKVELKFEKIENKSIIKKIKEL